jgi:ubiquitin C-terminal hydrolase
VKKISDDKLLIETDFYKYEWRIKSIIKYQKFVLNNNTVGHYTCLKRMQNSWLEISDNSFKIHKSLENLNDIYMIFLLKEKIEPKTIDTNKKISFDENIFEQCYTNFKSDQELFRPNQNNHYRIPFKQGLKNHGNTCFINAVLHSLFYCIPLCEYFEKIIYPLENLPITNSFRNLMISIWNNSYNPNMSQNFKNLIGTLNAAFSNYQQQDSHEFLVFLLNKLDEELLNLHALTYCSNNINQQNSIIRKLFNIRINSQIKCLICENKTIKEETEMVLSLAIESNRNVSNLYDCLSYHLSDEILSDENGVSCEKCKKKTRAIKSTEFISLPSIFCLVIKRFELQIVGDQMKWFKNNKNVSFPIDNLDMSNYIYRQNNQCLFYDLFAVCNHIGDVSSGHYTAVCRNPYKKEWYYYSDNVFSYINETYDISNNAAYILFYKKKS